MWLTMKVHGELLKMKTLPQCSAAMENANSMLEILRKVTENWVPGIIMHLCKSNTETVYSSSRSPQKEYCRTGKDAKKRANKMVKGTEVKLKCCLA